MARKSKEDTAKTYNALLDAAVNVFRFKGVSQTTLNDIALAADLTRGAVYWHFKNKEDVIKALWLRDAGPLHQGFIKQLEQITETSNVNQLEKLIKTLVKKAVQDPTFTQSFKIVMGSQEFTEQTSELQKFINQRRDELYRCLKTAITNLVNARSTAPIPSPEILTNSLWTHISGILHTHIEYSKSTKNVAKQTDELLGLWFDRIFI